VALTPDRIEALHEFRPVGRARRARRCYDHTEQQAARPVPIQAGHGSGAAFEMRRSLTLGLCLVDGRRGALRPMGVNSGMAGFGMVGCKSTPARGLFKWHRISRGLRARGVRTREFSDFLKNYLSEPREPPRPLGPKTRLRRSYSMRVPGSSRDHLAEHRMPGRQHELAPDGPTAHPSVRETG
jgi:hypothetical protein